MEEALRIKEKRGQGEVVAVSLGPERVKEALRSCLAMGADRAIHLLDAAWAAADTLTPPARSPPCIKQEAPALALFGRQAIDDDMGAVAAQVAELLGWPCASWIMEEAVDAGGTSDPGGPPGGGRPRGVRSAAARGGVGAEGAQRAALSRR